MREGGLEREPLEWEPKHAGLRLAGDVAALDSAGISGLHRPREWDATAAVEAPILAGEEVEGASLAPVVGALGGDLRRPYRARGVRRHEDVWAVAAKRIEVVE